MFVLCVGERLYSDAMLQVFYLGMSVYGYVNWKKSAQVDKMRIVTERLTKHLSYIVLALLATYLLGRFWTLFGAALPYVDAATTSFSILATYLVARRVVDNWIYWIVIDAVCIGVYYIRELYLVAFLFLLYTILACWAWWVWSREMAEQPEVV